MNAVRDLMTREPVVVRRGTTLAEMAAEMMRRDVRHLPMVDDDGALAGMVTDAAVFASGGLAGAHDELWVPFDEAAAARTAEDVAVPVAVTAGPDDDPARAFGRLLSSDQDAIVVVDGASRPIGILTEHDGVRLAHAHLPANLSTRHTQLHPLVKIDADDSAEKAWELMEVYDVRHVLVTTGGVVTGVISWRDLVMDGVPGGRSLRAQEVVRGTKVHTAPHDATLPAAAAILEREHIGLLPLVDAVGRPLRVVSRRDLIAALAATLDEEALFA